MNGRKDRLFNKWNQNNWISTCKRMNPDVYLTPYTEINLKCINDLNINLSEGKIDVNLHDIRLGNGFLNMTPKAKTTKVHFIKIKNFHASKDIIKKVKRQSTEWERYMKITYLIRI